jgi:hypothetical protein
MHAPGMPDRVLFALQERRVIKGLSATKGQVAGVLAGQNTGKNFQRST